MLKFSINQKWRKSDIVAMGLTTRGIAVPFIWNKFDFVTKVSFVLQNSSLDTVASIIGVQVCSCIDEDLLFMQRTENQLDYEHNCALV